MEAYAWITNTFFASLLESKFPRHCPFAFLYVMIHYLAPASGGLRVEIPAPRGLLRDKPPRVHVAIWYVLGP